MNKLLVSTALAASVMALSAVPAAATNLLSNPGFESGALSPWYQARDFSGHGGANWAVETTVVHSGTYAAGSDDNYELRQDFTPTAGSSISDISVWANVDAMAYDLFYTDGTDSEFLVFGSKTWQQFDLTSNLDVSKTLSGISFFGNSGAQAYIDDAVVDAGGVPEPVTWVLMLVGMGGLGASLRGRRALASA